MKRKKAVRKYRKLAAKLMKLHSTAADHISRRDNNEVFEMSCTLQHIADRVESGYPDMAATSATRIWTRNA